MTNNFNDPHIRALVAQTDAAAAPHGITVRVEQPSHVPGLLRLCIDVDREDYSQPVYWLGDLTDEHLTDLIAYFTNHTIDKENSMNIYSTDLFQYMAGDMIGQSTIVLTVADVTMESMNSGKGGQQTKPCLRFKERSKLMVLNKTNAKSLAAVLGPETENWKGARVTIAAPVVDAFGKSARSLRVVDVEPPPALRAPLPRAGDQQQAQAQADWLADTADDDAKAAPQEPPQ